MEEGLLLLKEEREERRRWVWGDVGEEVKRVGWIAAPMVVVTLSQNLLQVVCTMMVGHLGELALSSSAIAVSLAGVSGFSLLLVRGEVRLISLLVCYLDSLNTIATLYAITYGFGAAVSTRVSNELGAGNPQGARVAVFAVMFLAVAETTVVSATLFACRRVFGYTFSNEKEVVDYVTAMAPLVCLSVIMDSIQGVLSGVARGCGWQHIGAYVNLGAFYLCGIPIAAILAFWVQLRGKGLWIGIQAGAFATQARQRIFDGKSSKDDGLK
ncbi:hypothetical protein TEA_004125 [Camellia sinensis var. sinensis]|uniref:Uncharacterized protein n=1 Tax=Camellia sinensis var. sinensis TaxID=542762 RepID=A0A4S4EWT4_CAMSN|nr:hypothetical protein TEA_004125 [Camellia sinensis var. sinensis]